MPRLRQRKEEWIGVSAKSQVEVCESPNLQYRTAAWQLRGMFVHSWRGFSLDDGFGATSGGLADTTDGDAAALL
jgi:hypothetical protein